MMIRKDYQKIIEDEINCSDDNIDSSIKNRIYYNIRSSILGASFSQEGASNSTFNASSSNEKASKRNLIIVNSMRWAAILLLPIISAVITYQVTGSKVAFHDSPVTFATGNGEKAEITLPDGSHVWLNSGTVLTYSSSFNHKNREINLSGEAYFEVAANKNKPFMVYTKDITVEALGTSFNVTAYEEDLFASSVLIDGAIRVMAGDQERFLAENHRATFYKASGTLASDAVYASDYIMWKDGFLYFNNNSFEEIAQKLSRMFNVKIEFNSDDLRPIRFSGTLGNSSIKNVLDILSLTSPMDYEMNGTVVELYYRR